MSFCFSLILLLLTNYSVQGQNSTDLDTILTSVEVTTASIINSERSQSTVLLCPGEHIDPPNCTKCASDYETKDDKCLKIQGQVKSSRSTGRRIFLIFLACLLTVFVILSMFIVYGRLNQQRQGRSLSNPQNTSDSSNFNTNTRNRFNNILRSIGLNNLNKRGRFNFFSISNNNNNSSSGQHQQTQSLRAPLSENPDEALLFDDPYADGGFNSSSANPYKSLTLAVT